MPRKVDIEGKVIDAALKLAEAGGWRRLNLADIADEAGITLDKLYQAFRSKPAILAGFVRRMDVAMLEGATPDDTSETPHDLVFDTLMRRFDAMAPYRGAIRVLVREGATMPMTGLATAAALTRSMRWALQTARVDTTGVAGAVRIRALGAAYLATLRVWLGDDTADLARTMAALDKNLRRAGTWAGLTNRGADAQPAAEATG